MTMGGAVAGGTTGSVPFIGAGTALSQDNAKFFWDDSNFRLGLGTATPATTLDVVGSAQFSTFPTLPAGNPVSGTDAVNKTYADTLASGLSVRASCSAATTGAIVLVNSQTIDTVPVSNPMRVLVKNQALPATNGIYVVTDVGAWVRATDYDADAEVVAGSFTSILGGAVNGNTQWIQTTPAPTINVDPLVFSQLSAASSNITASNGAKRVANDIQVDYDNSSVGIVAAKLAVKANGITSAMFAPAFTASRIPFSDGTNLTVDALLNWDNTNKRLGVGTAAPTAFLDVVPNIVSATTPTGLSLTGAAHTNLLNSETNDIYFKLNRTVQFAGGGAAITNQRAIRIDAPTYSSIAAQTITTASTFEISNQPLAGANVTIGARIALRVLASTPTINNPIATFEDSTSAQRQFFITWSSNEAAIGCSSNRNLLFYNGGAAHARIYGDAGDVGNWAFTQAAQSSNARSHMLWQTATNTGQTAGTEVTAYNFNASSTKTWATGAIATQREVLIQAPTYAFNAASTITTAATLAITGAPIQGTNATLSSSLALWIQAGAARFAGYVFGSSSGITAANDLVLGGTNQNVVAGATTINAITLPGGVTAGTKITLVFSSTPTVKHNTAGGAGTAKILLAGSTDFVAAANSVLELEYDGTVWQEIARKAA